MSTRLAARVTLPSITHHPPERPDDFVDATARFMPAHKERFLSCSCCGAHAPRSRYSELLFQTCGERGAHANRRRVVRNGREIHGLFEEVQRAQTERGLTIGVVGIRRQNEHHRIG